jgi:hypothetical protein
MDYVEAARAVAGKRQQVTDLDRAKARKRRYPTAANLPKPEKPPTAKNRKGEAEKLRLMGYRGGI